MRIMSLVTTVMRAHVHVMNLNPKFQKCLITHNFLLFHTFLFNKIYF